MNFERKNTFYMRTLYVGTFNTILIEVSAGLHFLKGKTLYLGTFYPGNTVIDVCSEIHIKQRNRVCGIVKC